MSDIDNKRAADEANPLAKSIRPTISISQIAAAVDESIEQDRAVVRAAWRNTVSLAMERLCGRKATESGIRDVQFEERMWALIEKEFQPRADFSGKEEKK